MIKKVLHESIGIASQDVTYEGIYLHGDIKLKVKVVSNPYANQCIAKVEIWTGTGWNLVHSLLPSQMGTPVGIPYSDKGKLPSKAVYQGDIDSLLKVAQLII